MECSDRPRYIEPTIRIGSKWKLPKVSVIIPTYNRGEILRSAITSVLSQTFQDFEIIVVDDASRDNTREVVSSINDKRIRYIRHEINKGDAATRNAGVRFSNGKLIAFLDDDDEWLPEKLEKQINPLENSLSNVGGVYTGFVEIERRSGKELSEMTPTKKGNIFNDILFENCIATSSVLLRKECFDKVGLFDEDIPFCSDYDMWVRISKEFHFEYINESLIKYFRYENGLSTNIESVIQGREMIIGKYGELLAVNKKIYSYHYFILGRLYCQNRNTKRGKAALLRAIKLYHFGDIRYYIYFFFSLFGVSGYKKLVEIKTKIFTPAKTPQNLHNR